MLTVQYLPGKPTKSPKIKKFHETTYCSVDCHLSQKRVDTQYDDTSLRPERALVIAAAGQCPRQKHVCRRDDVTRLDAKTLTYQALVVTSTCLPN